MSILNSAGIMRWVDVGLYSLVGGFAGNILISAASNLLPAALTEVISAPKTLPLLVITILIASLAVCWLHWIIGFRLQHTRFLLKYPPLPVAAAGGLALAFVLNPEQGAPTWFSIAEVVWALVIYLTLLSISGLLKAKGEFGHGGPKKLISPPESSSVALKHASAEDLIGWAEQEFEIFSTTEDRLEVRSRLERLHRILLHAKRKTIALVGEYGVGKSSIINLLSEKASQDKQSRFMITPVSCWGFDNPAAAQEAVLKQIIRRLFLTVDCFGIQGMPAKYVEALSKTTNVLEVVFKFVDSGDPDAQLRKVSPILRAIDARLVVVIEDTDRQSASFDITSIEGLLNRFRNVPGLSFIITAGPNSKIDFTRLCEHTEYVFNLDENTIMSALDTVRHYCHLKYKEDIDLAEPKKQSRRESDQTLRPVGLTENQEWRWAMAKLIGTPRKLKAVIRRFQIAWSVLHGEVDIDELLVATTLRVCVPSTLGFLMRRHETIEAVQRKSDNSPDQMLALLKKEWAELPCERTHLEPASVLLQYLFRPAFILFDKPSYDAIESIQQFRSQMRRVYRERILNESLSDGLSDQAILKMTQKALDEDNWAELAKTIEDSEEALSTFLFFESHMLPDESLWKLLSQVVIVVKQKHHREPLRHSGALRDLCHKCREQFQLHPNYPDKVYEMVSSCIPKHLAITTELATAFFVDSPLPILNHFTARLNARLKETFLPDKWKLLADALDPTYPYTLGQLFSVDHPHQPESSWKPDWTKWNWLAPILLEGLKQLPDIFAPQLSCALGLSLSSPQIPSGFLLNESRLNELFGKQAKALMKGMTKPFSVNTTFDQKGNSTDFSLVNERAKQWLGKHQ